MSNETFHTYLIEKPLSLVYWELSESINPIKEVLARDTEVKEIKEVSQLDTWLKTGMVKNVVLAGSLNELKDFRNFLEGLFPEVRRGLFLVLIAPELKSFDPVESFVYGANLVLNPSELSFFEKFYQKAKTYYENLYKPYKRAIEKLWET